MEVLSFSVVALIDALGFRQIEKRMDPLMAIEAMKVARASLANMTDWMNGDGGYQHFHTIGGKPVVRRWWTSDTIGLIVQPPRELTGRDLNEYQKASLLDVATVCVGYFLRSAADSVLPFAFRGVVTVGDLIVDDEDIFMGSAICDAAENCEDALGAFVWLTKAASKLPTSAVARNHHGLVRYKVPLHQGRSVNTNVVSPFIDTLVDSEPGRRIRESIINAMEGDREDIVAKRVNTIAFLDHAVEMDFRPTRLFGAEG